MGSRLTEIVLVLDSWPILEWIKGREPHASHFGAVLKESADPSVRLEMTRIHHGEVIYSTRNASYIPDREADLQRFLSLPIRVHTVSDCLVDQAVELKSKYPFSFADAFAAALAIQLRAPLVTGDLEFRRLEMDGL